MSENKTTVVIADDHALSRGFFELTVRSSPNYAFAASFTSADDAVHHCLAHPPDLLILDIMMRDGNDGLTAAARLKSAFPKLRIILVTSMAELRWLEVAQKLGIEGFWYKDAGVPPFLEIMDRVMAGECVYPGTMSALPFGEVTRAELSDREIDVLRELTACATNQQIAETLNISVNTVRRHIQNMLEKTGFSDRLELAVHARELNLVVSDRDRKKNNQEP